MKQKRAVQNGGAAKVQKASAAGVTKPKIQKNKPKKNEKVPVKLTPPKNIEEETDEESEEDSGADLATDVIEAGNESESEDEEEIGGADEDDDDEDESDEQENETARDLLNNEAEEDDEDEDDEGESEEDENEDEDNSDGEEGPAETSILKKSPESAGKKDKKKKSEKAANNSIYKIKTGRLPKDFPAEQVIIVTNLPKRFKQIDIVEVFAKYGTLHTINPVHGPVSSIAYIAYTTPEAALKAVAGTDQKAKIKDAVLKTQLKISKTKQKGITEERKQQIKESKTRSVYVKNLRPKTSEEEIRQHFEECGEIESVKIFDRKNHSYGCVSFANEEAIVIAKKLHNTVLNNSNIWVFLPNEQSRKELVKDPKRTILIKNTQEFESFPGDKLAAIFSKCGEIETVTILCKKLVLAFITFKDEKGAQKALKLNGTKAQGIDLEIEEYKVLEPKPKTAIFVQNVKPGVPEKEIREHFSEAGEIESVFLKNNFAIIKYTNQDSFCKSFLLNESTLQDQLIFIEPYSEKKQFVLKKKNRKRPMHHSGPSNFKKFKHN